MRLKISLTQNKFAIVGPRDYAYLMQFKWCYNDKYATRKSLRVNNKQPNIRMHRVILERMGYLDFQDTDHINQDKLDNRRCNLRPATRSQNKCNQDTQGNNTSGFKGVSWYKRYKKWVAYIKVNRKRIHLGYFDTKLEAAIAYNNAARKYHGRFAKLNVL